MFTYQAKDEFLGFMFATPKKNPAIPLYTKIRCALSSICTIVEEWGKENAVLDEWASKAGNGSAYVTFEVVKCDTGDMYEFKAGLIIESVHELPLGDHFVKVDAIDLGSYNQQFEVYSRDGTGDYSRSVSEFPIDEDSIIIMQYKLISDKSFENFLTKTDLPVSPIVYFSLNLFLCTRRPDV